jgi:HAD superfamily hydrolase (TIGR01509 family)
VTAIIFDCDGVLVDSEVLAHEIEMESLAEAGLVYSSDDFRERFMGLSDRAFFEALEADALQRIGRSIRDDTFPRMKARYRKALEERLKEVPGALALVSALPHVKAVASSSTTANLELKLRRTLLWDHFAPHIFSAEHVERGKPAPDLFLHAAKSLGVPAKDCLVLEDSVNGVAAGLAAGMRVWAFCGGGHIDPKATQRLLSSGAERAVASWAEAGSLLRAL